MKMVILAGLLLSAPAYASSPAAWAELDNRAKKACAQASGFREPLVSPATVRFSDTLGLDMRLVAGIYPQPHMKGARGQVLCAYNRRTGATEVQDADAWRPRTK